MFKYTAIWRDSREALKAQKLESEALCLALGPTLCSNLSVSSLVKYK